jgi:hypothetical protein
VLRYARWLGAQPELMGALAELQCEGLGCWYAPGLCRGHVLASLAADEPSTEPARIIAELQGH